MNRFTIILIISIFPFLGKAQENTSHLIPAKIKQHSIMLGGTATGSYSRFSNSIDTRSLTGYETGNRLQAVSRFKAGYFLIHDLVVGANINANYTRSTTTITSKLNTTNTEEMPDETYTEVNTVTYALIGPYARYYLDNGFFGELTASAGLNNFSRGKQYNLYEGTIGVGYAHFINEKVSIEPMLSLQYLLETNTVRNNYSYGPMVGVGVQVYLLQEQSKVIRYGL